MGKTDTRGRLNSDVEELETEIRHGLKILEIGFEGFAHMDVIGVSIEEADVDPFYYLTRELQEKFQMLCTAQAALAASEQNAPVPSIRKATR
jgi:hypothetical protein